MRKTLSDAERDLWTRFVREVRPLRPEIPADEASSDDAPVPATEEPLGRAAGAPPTASLRRTRPKVELVLGTRGAGMDDTSWRALGAARAIPARRLDLHGHTVEAAFRALGRFLQQASHDRIRCVEIVTGHGRTTGGGAIRRELPHWLNRPELRALVVAGRHPDPGNAGAVRLLLRRRRT